MRKQILILLINSFIFVTTTVNAQWSDNPSVNTFINAQSSRHTIVSDNNGGAIIFWQSQTNLYSQHIDSQGISLWTNNGILICSATLEGDVFDAISDGNGGAIVTWKDNRNTNLDIFAQKISQNGIIQWTQNGVVISSASNTQFLPQLVTDGNGGAIITWQDGQYPENPQLIKAQRISTNGIPLWTTNGIIIGNTTGIQIQTHPNITIAENGGAIISWFDFRAIASWWDVYAQKIDGNGNLLWNTNGVFIGDIIQNEESQSDITSDGLGGAIIAWSDYSGNDAFDHNIHVQYVSSNGVTQWSPNNNVCNVTGDQTEIRVLHDSSQNTYVVWQDLRASTSQVFAQRFSNSGIAQWAENGKQCSSTIQGTSGFPEVQSDGIGGIIITYDSDKLYAQRITNNGDFQWGTNGVVACTYGGGFGGSFETHSISNTNGGIIVIWNNESVIGHSGLYAQNICGNGQLGNCSLGIPENLNQTINIFPNPTNDILSINSSQQLDKIIITDLLGKEIFQIIPNSNVTNIQMLGYESGLYFVKLYLNGNVNVKKILVK